MRPSENECTQYVGWISEMLEGTLAPSSARQLEEHLAGCRRCQAELVLQKRIVEALEEEIHPRLSIDFTQRVSLRAVEMAELSERSPLWPRVATVLTLAFAACAMILFRAEIFGVWSKAFGPAGSALSVAVGRVGGALSGIAVGAAREPGHFLSGLGDISQPVLLGLFLLLTIIPFVWGLQKVVGVLRH